MYVQVLHIGKEKTPDYSLTWNSYEEKGFFSITRSDLKDFKVLLLILITKSKGGKEEGKRKENHNPLKT